VQAGQFRPSVRRGRATSIRCAFFFRLVGLPQAKRKDAGSWDVQVLERMREILFNPRHALVVATFSNTILTSASKGQISFGCTRPALEAYSEHPFVKKTEGGLMTVCRRFLTEVRRLVLQFALGELPGFQDLQAQTQGRGDRWNWTR